jgi:hypothetical protein
MATDIRQQIALLVSFQEAELEIRKIKHALSQVDRRTAELDNQLDEYTAAVENSQTRIRELAQRSRTLESELQTIQSRIAKSQEKLRSIKTNKEYQSALKEIEDLGAMASKIEDEILTGMEQIEDSQKELKNHHSRLQAQAGLIRAEKESVIKESQETTAKLQHVENAAARLGGQISPEILALYRRVQAKKADGVAIVSATASVCRGCHVNFPPQMYNELQRVDRLKNCPNCERIIYWKEEEIRSE